MPWPSDTGVTAMGSDFFRPVLGGPRHVSAVAALYRGFPAFKKTGPCCGWLRPFRREKQQDSPVSTNKRYGFNHVVRSRMSISTIHSISDLRLFRFTPRPPVGHLDGLLDHPGPRPLDGEKLLHPICRQGLSRPTGKTGSEAQLKFLEAGTEGFLNMAVGQNPVPPVNIPIPTKIDQNGWCTGPKMIPLVLTHSHMDRKPA